MDGEVLKIMMHDLKKLKDELEELRYLKDVAEIMRNFRKELIEEECD